MKRLQLDDDIYESCANKVKFYATHYAARRPQRYEIKMTRVRMRSSRRNVSNKNKK